MSDDDSRSVSPERPLYLQLCLYPTIGNEIRDYLGAIVCPREILPREILPVTKEEGNAKDDLMVNFKYYSKLYVGKQVRIFFHKYPTLPHGMFHFAMGSTINPPEYFHLVLSQVNLNYLEPDLIYYATLVDETERLILNYVTDKKGMVKHSMLNFSPNTKVAFKSCQQYYPCKNPSQLTQNLEQQHCGILLCGDKPMDGVKELLTHVFIKQKLNKYY